MAEPVSSVWAKDTANYLRDFANSEGLKYRLGDVPAVMGTMRQAADQLYALVDERDRLLAELAELRSGG